MSLEILLGSAAGLSCAALFGLSNIVYKSQSDEIRPLTITSLKMWVSLPLMVALVAVPLFLGIPLVPITSILPLILSIIPGAIIGDMIYFYSQARIGVSRAFPIAMVFPLITYLLSIMLLGDIFILNRLFGMILVILGVSVITREQAAQQKDTKQKSSLDRLGIVLALVAAVFWAVASIFAEVAIRDVQDPVSANFIRILAGSVALIPVFTIAHKRGMPSPTKRATKLTLVAGFFGMGLGSLGYIFAVKFTGAAVSAVLSSTAPLFAIPASAYFLRERVTRHIVLGTITTVIGIWLVIL
jgi:drug/metabolite transporter (DMT)-like permease